MSEHIARAETKIEAPASRVWEALTDPEQIEQFMFGSRVTTDWKPGSSIVWKGEYEGKPYEDKGQILEFEPERRLRMTHFSPMSGDEDVPENYHTLTYELEARNGSTRVSLTQDGNDTAEAAEHSQANWEKMLSGLKATVEAD
jgi:uncharacterized protein YndB with AHSA1/START domain